MAEKNGNEYYKSRESFKLTLKELRSTPGFPDEKNMENGPVVVIECVQEIPCNPCETICKKKVISIGHPITNLPRITNFENCNGCGKCIVICPGLSIFVINKNFSEKESSISIPYEFLPLPEKDDAVEALGRNGEYICNAKVIRINKSNTLNNTNVVTIAFPKNFVNEVRFFRRSK